MKTKLLYTLELIILMIIFFISGHLCSLYKHPQTPPSLFQLQEEYSQKAQNQLQNFLTVLVGPGNVKTNVRFNLKNIHQTITQKERTKNGLITKTNSVSGIGIESQHISVLINQLTPVNLSTYRTLIQEGMGIDLQKGDTLSVQILPFYKVPFLTFGFSYLTLIRLAGFFLVLFFVLIILLATLYFKENTTNNDDIFFSQQTPLDQTWAFIQELTPQQLKIALHYIDKKTLVQVLKISPFSLHQQISQVLSAHIWHDLMRLNKDLDFSESDAFNSKQKIHQTIQALKRQGII